MSTKKKLYIVVLIWAAVALQIFITKRIDRESQMVTQVMSDGVENVTAAEVKLYAHYGDETMTEAAREKILQRVGEKLGIISGYDIITSTEGENTSTTFVKKGENGDTTIRLISMEQTNADGSTIQENYLMTEIALKNQSTENIYRCKEQLDQIYTDLGLSGSSNLYLCSQEKGRMRCRKQPQISSIPCMQKSAMKSNYKIRCASMDTAIMSRNMCIKMITR